MKQTFQSEVLGRGPDGAWIYMSIPFNVEEVFGKKSQVPVVGTLNGVPFRNSLMPRGDGTHHMHINKELLENAKTQVGETVKVVMEVDTVTRTVTIPEDFRGALKLDAEADRTFAGLCYSHQKEYVDWITSAKKTETRSRRIEDARRMLLEKKRVKS